MSRKTNLDKFHDVMFEDIKTIENLTPVEKAQLLRYRFAFTCCLENPSIEDNVLRDKLTSEFSISISQAYRDIAHVKIILPNIKAAGKEWIRYIVNEELKSAIREAKDAGNERLKERIMAIANLAKYNKLDQDDSEQIPWEEIIPIPIEPTTDPTVLDITPLENAEEEIRKLIEKHKGDIEIEYIDFVDITKKG